MRPGPDAAARTVLARGAQELVAEAGLLARQPPLELDEAQHHVRMAVDEGAPGMDLVSEPRQELVHCLRVQGGEAEGGLGGTVAGVDGGDASGLPEPTLTPSRSLPC